VPDGVHALLFRIEGEVGHAGECCVAFGPAQLFLGYLFPGNRLYDIGAGDEHHGDAADHEGEIGNRGGVNRATRRGAQDGRDLRHNAGSQRVAHKYLAVSRQAGNAFLDARATGVGDADDGRTVAHGHVHDLADLFSSDFRQRPAEDGEVLGVEVDSAAVDLTVARDD